MPNTEIVYWKEYFSNNPTIREQNDYIIYLLSISNANFINANKAKGKKAVNAEDFLPGYLKQDKKENREKSLEQQKQDALNFASQYKSKVGKE